MTPFSQTLSPAKAALLGVLLLCNPATAAEKAGFRADTPAPIRLSDAATGDPAVTEILTLRLAHMHGAIRDVTARLTRPARVGRVPAVVLVPDALGLDQRLSTLADRFVTEGWATLEVDLDPVSNDGHVTPGPGLLETQVDAGGLVGDLALVLGLFGEDRDIDPRRIAVVGLGTGGRGALLTGSEPAMSLELDTYGPRFAAHAAFYPGCDALAAEGLASPIPWSAAPMAVFLAGDDGRSSPAQCGALRDRLAVLGRVPLVWNRYPRASYGWDLGSVLGQGRNVMANLGAGRVAVVQEADIAEDAAERLMHFLRQVLASSRTER